MSRKHFQAIADVIKDQLSTCDHVIERTTIENTAKQLADVCQQFNSNFNRDRFLAACDVWR